MAFVQPRNAGNGHGVCPNGIFREIREKVCQNGRQEDDLNREHGGPDLLICNVDIATMADTGEAYGVVRDGLV
ncbi:MAG: hypothetical protein OXN18_02190, partial [Gemmatimonadota bacterium]|nr:hypothetical protein [Gemmatimonadota bacterium]